MVEYGGGINNGPAGQVGGAGAPHVGGSSPDLFTSAGNAVNDAVNTVTALPFEMQVLLIVVVFLGLIVLRRAF
ncbi:MAG TPA: hypothetical protein VM451_07975 [Candidatus Limnocylindria bacterium]|nr:hypothetical protein [Candidatus Limnocylindria bacterium]